MKTRRALIITSLLLAVMLIATAASAQQGYGKRGQAGRMANQDCYRGQDGNRGPGGGRMLQFLDLSEEQQAAVDKLREGRQDIRVAHRKEMMRLRNELEGLMLQDKPDAAKARKLITKMGEMRTEMKVQAMEHRLEIRELLTDEQIDKLIAHKGKLGGRGQGRRHGGDRGCGFDCNGKGRGRI
jgi:Spy/CpxP family protein refolding chaperone